MTASIALIALTACQQAEQKQNSTNEISSDISSISQTQLTTLAEQLVVKYRFLSNIETDCPDLISNNDADNKAKAVPYCYGAEILLTTPESYLVNNWQLNFSQVYPVYASRSDDFTLQHINGDIHQITPKKNFAGFQAQKTKKIKLWVKSTLITESELMPNYWLSSDNLQPKVVTSTRTQVDAETGLEVQPYVVPFSDVAKQIKSSPDDINQYASAQWLYDHEASLESLAQSKGHLTYAIVPTPKSLQVLDETKQFDFSQGVKLSLINIDNSAISAALSRLALFGFELTDDSQPAVELLLVKNADKPFGWRAGHYQLTINEDKITITAQDDTGVFYGLQSLASLIQLGKSSLPLIVVDDQPHYAYRGQHVDVARNFHNKAFIFRLIEQMAAYKLNKLHLHLAEDEAWRLALPSFPELTSIGSKRCMALNDKQCLQPQLGGANASERDGFYSIDDYKDILRFASAHHIQVIPSLDMPGHSRAAIKAMEARYHYYMQQENELEAKRYLLTDFDDKTQYSSIQHYRDNTLNICMESTYAFVDRVLDDLKAMHQEASHPLALYHIGADETAGAWLDSPVCKALIADKSNEFTDVKHLGAHFIERVAAMVVNKGIGVGGWNDGLQETRVANMPADTYSYIWGALPWGAHQQVSEQSHRGWNIVLSIPDVLYFDFPYQIDPKERGYHWASRRITTRSLFNFMPDNLPIHAEFRVDTLGKHFASDDRLQKDGAGNISHQPLAKGFTVQGIQGQLWSETVRSDKQAEYMIYPRLLALAERAWHQADWQVPYDNNGKYFDKNTSYFTPTLKTQRDKSWLAFSQTLGVKELAKLERAGVFYRLPTVGARVTNGKLYANVAIKGVNIEYKEQRGHWQTYTKPVAVKIPISIRAKANDLKRVGRTTVITE